MSQQALPTLLANTVERYLYSSRNPHTSTISRWTIGGTCSEIWWTGGLEKDTLVDLEEKDRGWKSRDRFEALSSLAYYNLLGL